MLLRERLGAGETLYTAWSGIPDPLVAEFLARTSFDAVTLDMQHGCHTTESVLRGVAAIKLAGKPAVVRIPVGSFDMASRALDFGAAAVIAPMVNSLADARAFAGFMKFPPLGERSWGPTRLLALQGKSSPQAYLESANGETLAIAMIETRAASSSDRRIFRSRSRTAPASRQPTRTCLPPRQRLPRGRHAPERFPARSRSTAKRRNGRANSVSA
jgi:4-hydroxy-2-oxoheptanedioate aldolase